MLLKSFSALFPGVGLMVAKVGGKAGPATIKELALIDGDRIVKQTTSNPDNIAAGANVTYINLTNAVWYEYERASVLDA